MLQSVVVLRHAKAGNRADWPHDDLARPLDPDGLADSLGLVTELADWPVDEILTSPAARCQHTVAALAAHRRVPVSAVDWLLAGTDPAEIRDRIDQVAPSVLLCSHRELIPDLLAVLGPLPVPLADVPVLDKGAAFGLRYGDDGSVVDVETVHPRHAVTIA